MKKLPYKEMFLIVFGAIIGQLISIGSEAVSEYRTDAMGSVVFFKDLEYSNAKNEYECSYIPGFIFFRNLKYKPITGVEFYSFDGTTARLANIEVVYPKSLQLNALYDKVVVEKLKPRQQIFLKIEMEYCILGPSRSVKVVANQRLNVATVSKKDVFMFLNSTGRGGFSGHFPWDIEQSFFYSVLHKIRWHLNINDKEVWIGASRENHEKETSLNSEFGRVEVHPLIAE